MVTLVSFMFRQFDECGSVRHARRRKIRFVLLHRRGRCALVLENDQERQSRTVFKRLCVLRTPLQFQAVLRVSLRFLCVGVSSLRIWSRTRISKEGPQSNGDGYHPGACHFETPFSWRFVTSRFFRYNPHLPMESLLVANSRLLHAGRVPVRLHQFDLPLFFNFRLQSNFQKYKQVWNVDRFHQWSSSNNCPSTRVHLWCSHLRFVLLSKSRLLSLAFELRNADECRMSDLSFNF